MKQIVLLSDTHHSLDKRFIHHFKTADEIWHAGDIGSLEVTDELKKYAPIKVVWGNIDSHTIRSEFKEVLYFKSEEIKVMIIALIFYHMMLKSGSLAILVKQD